MTPICTPAILELILLFAHARGDRPTALVPAATENAVQPLPRNSLLLILESPNAASDGRCNPIHPQDRVLVLPARGSRDMNNKMTSGRLRAGIVGGGSGAFIG